MRTESMSQEWQLSHLSNYQMNIYSSLYIQKVKEICHEIRFQETKASLESSMISKHYIYDNYSPLAFSDF